MHTSTMNKMPIKFWEWNNALKFIHSEYPYRLHDFIQSMSENQVSAKSWMIERLMVHPISSKKEKEIWVLGSWYGTIIIHLLLNKIPDINKINLVDYDEEALYICRRMFKDYRGLNILETHHYDINFDWPKIQGDLVINTSCEHMWPMKDYDFGDAVCAFQSNNFMEEPAHINCVNSEDELVEQSGLSQIDYKGTIPFHKYDDHHKRFMVIGKK